MKLIRQTFLFCVVVRTMDGVNKVGEVNVSRLQMEAENEDKIPPEHEVEEERGRQMSSPSTVLVLHAEQRRVIVGRIPFICLSLSSVLRCVTVSIATSTTRRTVR